MTQRLRRFRAVLEPLGMWEGFAALPRGLQEALARNKFPDPVLDFDQSYPDDAEHQALRKQLLKQFDEAGFRMEGTRVSVRDFLSVLVGLLNTTRCAVNQPGLPSECVSYMRAAAPVLEELCERYVNDMWAAVHRAVICPLVARSRLDRRLLAVRTRQDEAAAGRFVVRMTVGAYAPQTRQVVLDGAARPMARVGTCHEWDGVRWAEFEGKPVYAQSHALRQLRQRVDLPRMMDYLECWLHQSLAEPVVAERMGVDMLVEFRIDGHRLGYLVVTPKKDLVAVRTFLFLTMEQTPEGRQLRRRLGLTRRETDYLGLADLSAFTQTDLCDDDEMRELLSACGCGHLFTLADEGLADYAPQPKPLAEEVRRYLGMAA